jgi:hypothetical protein
MNLIKYLEIDESQVHPDARRSLLLAEKVWTENGSPLDRWELVRVLEEILRRCIASGIWYAPMLLQRKKAIERDSWRPRPRDAMRSATPPRLYDVVPPVAERINPPAAPAAVASRVLLPKDAPATPLASRECPICHGTALKAHADGFRGICFRCNAWEKGFPPDLGPPD